MKTVIIVLALLIILVLITRRSPSRGAKTAACPSGYMPSPVNSTWAGWNFNCLPDGIDSSLVGIPSDTYVRPITTIYAPIISDTGRAQSLRMGTPAKTLEFPPQHDRGLFPPQ
jgi:hypothetical protein